MCCIKYIKISFEVIGFFRCDLGLTIFKPKFLPAETLFWRCCSAETERLLFLVVFSDKS